MTKRKKNLIPICFILSTLLIISGCGKHENSMGTVGTISGAAIGSTVSNKENKGTGVIVGGLVGNYLGRSIGKEIDQGKKQINKLNVENEKLPQKWCLQCKKQIDLSSANNCPFCGNNLAYEKFCKKCNSYYPPNKYCKCTSTFSRVLETCLNVLVDGLNSEKTCFHCNKKIDIINAKNCPYCGYKIKRHCYKHPTKKYCSSCNTCYPIKSDYKYCPYCQKRKLLRFI